MFLHIHSITKKLGFSTFNLSLIIQLLLDHIVKLNLYNHVEGPILIPKLFENIFETNRNVVPDAYWKHKHAGIEFYVYITAPKNMRHTFETLHPVNLTRPCKRCLCYITNIFNHPVTQIRGRMVS